MDFLNAIFYAKKAKFQKSKVWALLGNQNWVDVEKKNLKILLLWSVILYNSFI